MKTPLKITSLASIAALAATTLALPAAAQNSVPSTKCAPSASSKEASKCGAKKCAPASGARCGAKKCAPKCGAKK